MSFTTPRDWTASETVTAAMMNEQFRDNLNALKAPDMALVTRTSAQALNGFPTTTTASWETEVYDVGGLVDIAGQPTRITIQRTGKYLVWYSLGMSALATTYNMAWVKINGGASSVQLRRSHAATSASNYLVVAEELALTAADYLQIILLQGTGAGGTMLQGSAFSPYFGVYFLGVA